MPTDLRFSQPRQWRRRPSERQLAIAFARNARAFHTMAWTDDDRVGAQSAYHSAIAIELGLKPISCIGVSLTIDLRLAPSRSEQGAPLRPDARVQCCS